MLLVSYEDKSVSNPISQQSAGIGIVPSKWVLVGLLPRLAWFRRMLGFSWKAELGLCLSCVFGRQAWEMGPELGWMWSGSRYDSVRGLLTVFIYLGGRTRMWTERRHLGKS